jgi:iron complex outermembrane receptor protein
LNAQITPDVLVYVKTARGFRGGALQPGAYNIAPVNPEIAVDYEVGMKGDFLNHRLRANMDVYQTNYQNKQEYVLVPQVGGNGVTSVLLNAATARIRGFEGQFDAVPIEGLDLGATVTYLEGVYTNFGTDQCGQPPYTVVDPPGVHCALTPESVHFNGTGQRFNEPPWRYSLSGRYEHEVGPGTLGFGLDWSWREHPVYNKLNLNDFALFPFAVQKKYLPSIGLLNARIDYHMPEQGLTMSFFMTNVLDSTYQVVSEFSKALGVGTAITQDPRMFGFQIKKTFGHES